MLKVRKFTSMNFPGGSCIIQALSESSTIISEGIDIVPAGLKGTGSENKKNVENIDYQEVPHPHSC